MKGLNIPEGTTVYIPAVRRISKGDSESSVLLEFCCDSEYVFNEHFLTEEELKSKFNEGLPKQGDDVEVRCSDDAPWSGEHRFVCIFQGGVLVTRYGEFTLWGQWRLPKPKTQLTLEQVEEKLGMEKGSLNIITN